MSGAILHALPEQALRALAEALDAGAVGAPYTALSVRRYASADEREALSGALAAMDGAGMSAAAIAMTLRLLLREREEAKRAVGSAELVWTGPKITGSRSRETAVVVDELFAAACTQVLVSSYSLWEGREVLHRLIERMAERPSLSARMFFNIPRADWQKDWTGEALVRQFSARFREHHWSGSRMPEVFYDPRSLELGPEAKGVLHAKCIVVDDERSLVTSANFSEAAHSRNIEAGVLLHNASFARGLRRQFETLVVAGALLRLPGLD
jgi:hypothetical protein